jgi:Ca2+-dependent lipid-binding protein
LNKLLLAVNQNPKLQALLPKVITDDQQWVELAESWLRFSPDEHVRWLNNLVSVMWPHLNTIIYKVMDETVEPLIEEAMKDMKGISGISFQDFSLGNVPLGIETIQVAQNHGDLVIDVALRWNAAVNIVADVTLSPSAITMNQKMALLSVTLNRLQVVGKVRIILKEVMPMLPVVGGITITLMEEPYIDFSVSIGEKSVGGLPGFKALINTLMKNAVKEHILFPMCVPIPLANPGFTATGERRDRSLFIEKLKVLP